MYIFRMFKMIKKKKKNYILVTYYLLMDFRYLTICKLLTKICFCSTNFGILFTYKTFFTIIYFKRVNFGVYYLQINNEHLYRSQLFVIIGHYSSNNSVIFLSTRNLTYVLLIILIINIWIRNINWILKCRSCSDIGLHFGKNYYFFFLNIDKATNTI